MALVSSASVPENMSIEEVGHADPCSALWGSLKTDCENSWLGNAFGDGTGGSSGGSSGGGTSLLDLFTNPVQFIGGLRHVFVRIAEVLVGGLLVIVGLNALIKAQTNVNVVGSVKSGAKKAVRAAAV